MGARDAQEMLEVAQQECIRLERENAALRAATPAPLTIDRKAAIDALEEMHNDCVTEGGCDFAADLGVDAVIAHLSAQPVEGEVEWAAQVSYSGLPVPVFFKYPDQLSVERFIKNPPLWFDRQDVTAKVAVHRTKAGPWIEAQP